MRATNLLLIAGLISTAAVLDLRAQESSRPILGSFRVGIGVGIASHTGHDPRAIGLMSDTKASGIGLPLNVAADYLPGGAGSPWRLEMALGFNGVKMTGSYDSRENVVIPMEEDSAFAQVDFRNERTFYTNELTINPSIIYDLGQILYVGAGGNAGVRIGESSRQSRKTILSRSVDVAGRGLTEVSFEGEGEGEERYTKTYPARTLTDAPAVTLGASLLIGAEFELGGGLAIGPRVGYTFGITPYVDDPAFTINTLSATATVRYRL